MLVAQGDLTAALQAYRDSLGIRERLAKADPGNAGWQRDLSVSYDSSPHGVAGFLSRSALTDGLFSRGSSHSHWLRAPKPARTDLMRRDALARLNALAIVMGWRSLSNPAARALAWS
ncbi:MAG: hypothetical protein WAN75_29480 [Xanthobacteraceae bacterium]